MTKPARSEVSDQHDAQPDSTTSRPGETTTTATSSTTISAPPAAAANPNSTAAAEGPGWWRPAPEASWQWQLDGEIDLEVDATVFDIDGFDVGATTVAALHDRGRSVVCYLSLGTVEDWRPDAGRFPDAVVGAPLEDWDGERWLDIRHFDAFADIVRDRLDMCRAKGFDGVEADNVDAFENETGFPLTPQDQIVYNRWLAAEAHARGLAIGLKNDRSQIGDLVDVFDFAIEEECFQYAECGLLMPFVDAGLAVFVAEYEACPPVVPGGFSVIHKRLDLDAWRVEC